MSTTHKMFPTTDVDEFVEMLKEQPNCEAGPVKAAYSVSPFLCFYFTYDEARALVDTQEAFEKLADHPYTVAIHPASERPHPYGSTRLPNLREYNQKKFNSNDSLIFEAKDEKNYGTSPTAACYFWRKRESSNKLDPENGGVNYSYAQFYYRQQWWQDNREAWRRFVLDTIERLRPAQVYSGFAMATSLEFGAHAEVSVWERALTPRFYGLDINDTFTMSAGRLTNLSQSIRRPPEPFSYQTPGAKNSLSAALRSAST